MIRSRLVRFIGFALALTAGFATPASAVAHGHAHEHQAEDHASANHVAPDGETSVLAVKSANRDAGDHPHSSVGAALTTKTGVPFVVVLATCVVLPSARVTTIAPPVPERALQFRVEAAHAPPPHLRAPPSLLG